MYCLKNAKLLRGSRTHTEPCSEAQAPTKYALDYTYPTLEICHCALIGVS